MQLTGSTYQVAASWVRILTDCKMQNLQVKKSPLDFKYIINIFVNCIQATRAFLHWNLASTTLASHHIAISTRPYSTFRYLLKIVLHIFLTLSAVLSHFVCTGFTYILTLVGPDREENPQGYLVFQFIRAVLLSTQVYMHKTATRGLQGGLKQPQCSRLGLTLWPQWFRFRQWLIYQKLWPIESGTNQPHWD